MATKNPKAKRKSAARNVPDLAAGKDPKGGAQKKEGPTDPVLPGNGALPTSKRRAA